MNIDKEVISVLQKSRIEGNKVFLPPSQMERKLYEKVNKVLEIAGGKWNRSAKAHVFADDPEEIIADAISTGGILDRKKEFQYYPTPDSLADEMVALAKIEGQHRILEPSAGDGAIVRAIRRASKVAPIVAVEVQEKHRATLNKFPFVTVFTDDFLSHYALTIGVFQRIIANPPFRNLQDIIHLRRMWDLLATGGILVCVTSPAWEFRQTKLCVEFREWLNKIDHAVRRLPEGTFAESGAQVRSLLLTLRK